MPCTKLNCLFLSFLSSLLSFLFVLVLSALNFAHTSVNSPKWFILVLFLNFHSEFKQLQIDSFCRSKTMCKTENSRFRLCWKSLAEFSFSCNASKVNTLRPLQYNRNYRQKNEVVRNSHRKQFVYFVSYANRINIRQSRKKDVILSIAPLPFR